MRVAGAERRDELAARSTGRRGPAKVAVVAAVAALVVGGGAVAALAVTGGSDESPATALSPAPVADAPEVDVRAMEAQRRKDALRRASQAAFNDAHKRPRLAPKGTPPKPKDPAGAPTAGNPVPAGEAQKIAKAMLPSFGFDPDTQFGCLVKLWNKESGWRTTAANPSGAYGIPQALPGSKMATYGDDWRTNPRTQIKWGLNYIKSRYKTPCGAWSAFLSKGWY